MGKAVNYYSDGEEVQWQTKYGLVCQKVIHWLGDGGHREGEPDPKSYKGQLRCYDRDGTLKGQQGYSFHIDFIKWWWCMMMMMIYDPCADVCHLLNCSVTSSEPSVSLTCTAEWQLPSTSIWGYPRLPSSIHLMMSNHQGIGWSDVVCLNVILLMYSHNVLSVKYKEGGWECCSGSQSKYCLRNFYS